MLDVGMSVCVFMRVWQFSTYTAYKRCTYVYMYEMPGLLMGFSSVPGVSTWTVLKNEVRGCWKVTTTYRKRYNSYIACETNPLLGRCESKGNPRSSASTQILFNTFILADTQVTSPQKLLIFIINYDVYRIKVSQQHFIQFWKQNDCWNTLNGAQQWFRFSPCIR